MAIVLTNGEYFIKTSKTGGIEKTTDIREAQTFYSCNVAMNKAFKAPGKCKGYYPYDFDDITSCGIKINKKQNRKKFTTEQRKIIYQKANGRCQLCGRKIEYEDMTLDHIVPLSLGGADEMDNLQCTDFACNKFKANIFPAEFAHRITEIFMFQMEKKHSNRLKWKIARKLMMEML
ncbi:HNH endonuclease [Oliverpabstia intestinalis]|uniref:HNH endonuclease n=1 Tax=Oliverpabstia intestinalis TaxID=2606633 RepID=UPI003F8CC44B